MQEETRLAVPRPVAGGRQRLTARQHKALVLLYTGHFIEDVAKAVGVSRMCLWEWRKSPAWQDAEQEYADAMLREGVSMIPAAMERLKANIAQPDDIKASNYAIKVLCDSMIQVLQRLSGRDRGDVENVVQLMFAKQSIEFSGEQAHQQEEPSE